MAELLNNNASSQLNGAINSSVTLLIVDSATSFPTSGNFRIRIDDELLLVTAVSSNTFTVTRGVEGTTAVSHLDDARVTHILTAGGLGTYVGEFHLRGTVASRPSAGQPGRIYLPTDHIVGSYDDGSVWRNFGPVLQFDKPDNSLYSWGNQGGTATVTDSNGGILLNEPTAATSEWQIRARLKTLDSTSDPFSVTVAFIPHLYRINFSMAGIGFRESATSKLTFFRIHNDSDAAPQISVVSSTTLANGTIGSLASSYSIVRHGTTPLVHWLRIRRAGSSYIYEYSTEGLYWHLVYSSTITSHFTTAADQLFLGIVAYNQIAAATFLSVTEA